MIINKNPHMFHNIMQCTDTGVPMLRKIRFDNSNVASAPYRNNIEDKIENLQYNQKCFQKIKFPKVKVTRPVLWQ